MYKGPVKPSCNNDKIKLGYWWSEPVSWIGSVIHFSHSIMDNRTSRARFERSITYTILQNKCNPFGRLEIPNQIQVSAKSELSFSNYTGNNKRALIGGIFPDEMYGWSSDIKFKDLLINLFINPRSKLITTRKTVRLSSFLVSRVI